jgi:hypothetical protein
MAANAKLEFEKEVVPFILFSLSYFRQKGFYH